MNSNNKCCFSDSYVMLLLLLLAISISSVEAQNPSSPPDGYPYAARFTPSMAIIIVVLVSALFFMAFFSVYIRRCSTDGGASVRPGLSIRRGVRPSRGLDSQVLESFPTFSYSNVKELKIGKGALECAICLNEFEDEETIRLITKCDHVFHAECIDAWLENHVTCPVCRYDLVPKPGDKTQDVPELLQGSVDEHEENTNTNTNTHVLIRIDPVLNRNQSVKQQPQSMYGLFHKFRSHSTGHSLFQPGENTERFTLRLPEHIRKEMIRKALLNRTGSTIRMTGEGSVRKGYRTGEGSSRGKSYIRMGSLDRVFSKTPSFLSRAFSFRSPKGEGVGAASTASTKIDKIPLNNIGPKSDEPVFSSSHSGRSPV